MMASPGRRSAVQDRHGVRGNKAPRCRVTDSAVLTISTACWKSSRQPVIPRHQRERPRKETASARGELVAILPPLVASPPAMSIAFCDNRRTSVHFSSLMLDRYRGGDQCQASRSDRPIDSSNCTCSAAKRGGFMSARIEVRLHDGPRHRNCQRPLVIRGQAQIS